MTDHTNKTLRADASDELPRLPLALHVRGKRRFYRKRSITQEELAAMSGASVQQIRRWENTRQLPGLLLNLLGVAIALGCSVEALVAPQLISRIRAQVNERRRQLDLDSPDDEPA